MKLNLLDNFEKLLLRHPLKTTYGLALSSMIEPISDYSKINYISNTNLIIPPVILLTGYFVTKILKKNSRNNEIVMNSPNSIVSTNEKGIILTVNKSFCKITGYEKNEVVGKNISIMNAGNTDKEKYKNLWDTILEGKSWKDRFLNKKKNGTTYWEDVKIFPNYDLDEKIIGFTGIKYDITAQKNLEDKLYYEANYDKLTQIPNRNNFVNYVENKLKTLRRNDEKFVIGLMDLDGFKSVNDKYGHDVGDKILIEAGKRVQSIIKRETDLIGRMGGDEFAFFLTNFKKFKYLEIIGSKLNKELDRTYLITTSENKELKINTISGSLGIIYHCDLSNKVLSFDKYYKAADTAMYQSKKNGKNCVTYISDMV